MLTDKTKEAFEKWLLNKFKLDSALYGHYEYLHFSKLPFSMQYGVIIDFFDDNRIEISESKGFYEIFEESSQNFTQYECDDKTRSEARKNAILKANNIFNETN